MPRTTPTAPLFSESATPLSLTAFSSFQGLTDKMDPPLVADCEILQDCFQFVSVYFFERFFSGVSKNFQKNAPDGQPQPHTFSRKFDIPESLTSNLDPTRPLPQTSAPDLCPAPDVTVAYEYALPCCDLMLSSFCQI